MTDNHESLRRRVVFRATQFLVACFCVGVGLRLACSAGHEPYVAGAASTNVRRFGSLARSAASSRGMLRFARTGNGDPFHPAIVQGMDLGSADLTVRFGHGAHRRVAEPHAGLATLADLM
jgi:hypothetical protein